MSSALSPHGSGFDGSCTRPVDAVVPLRALRAVVMQVRVRVADAPLESMRETALQNQLERVVLTLHRSALRAMDELVLRILSERLRDVAVEARDMATECRPRAPDPN